MTSFTPRKPRSASERRKAVQNGSASEAPAATPSTSRRPVRVHADGDYHRNGDDPAVLAGFDVGCVNPQIGPGALDGAGEKGIHPLIDLRAQARDLAFGDAGRAHGLDDVIDSSRRDAMDIGLLDHGRERLLSRAPRLQESRKVGALAQLRDGEINPPGSRLPGALA